jgi:predicted dehydrogenase
MSNISFLRRHFLARTAVATTLASCNAFPDSFARAADPPAARIKVGQIGTAHGHAAGKMETLRRLSSLYEVVGIVEPDAKRSEAIGKNPVYRDLPVLTEEQLLNIDGLQVVAVETEVSQLIPTAQRCVAAGMHLHLDKPAGDSLAALKQLHQSAMKNQVCIQMGYMFRYNPAFQLTCKAIREGWLGDVFELHGVISKKIGPGERQQLKQFAGGSMFELGGHLIDAMVWMLGKPTNVIPVIDHLGNDTLADNTLAVFDYPNGSATIRSSVVEPQGGRRRQFTVVGTEGTADIRPLEPARLELTLERACGPFSKGSQFVDLPKTSGRYDGDLIDLAAVVRGEKTLEWDAAHDLAVQETLLRASGMELNP